MDKKKVAIIGCGRVAAKHIKAIKTLSDEYELTAVVDTNEASAKKLLEASKVDLATVSIFDNYEKMINEIKPDVAAVTVPSGLHKAIALYSLDNGCNVLLEKPMTMSSSECKTLCELSEKTGKKIAMGHIYRYFPIVGLLHDDIGKGVFGKVTHGTICVRWGHGQDYYDASSWRGTWKSDGGALMNQTIHAIDLLLWIMNGKAVEVTGMLSQRLRKIEAEDLGMAVIKLDNGALASIEGTTATLESDHEASFTVFCEKARIHLGLRKGKPVLDIRDNNGKSLNGKYLHRQIKSGGLKSFTYALNPHTAIYRNLSESIDNNTNPIADAYAGYSSVDNLLGIYKAAKNGCTIKLPLSEDFSSSDMIGFFES